MFKPMPMKKVSVLLLAQDLEAFTRLIQEKGLVQIAMAPMHKSMERHLIKDLMDRLSDLTSKVERMISLLEEAQSMMVEKGSLVHRVKRMVRPTPPREPLDVRFRSAEELLEWCGRGIAGVSGELDRLGESLEKSNEEMSRLDEDLRLIRELLPLKVPLGDLRRSELTASLFFHLPPETVGTFTRACRGSISPVHISEISGTAKRLLMGMVLQSDRTKLLTQIHRFEAELVELPDYDGSPTEVESEILRSMERLQEDTDRTAKRINRLAGEHLDNLKVMAEVLQVERERINALRLLSKTENAVYLLGWVPEKDLEKLQEVASASTGGRYVLRSSDPSEDELRQVPIRLQNPVPFSSFNWVTRMYGMPNYREVDPTPFLVPTFAVFFGTCLTDAGYGIILALVSFFVLRKAWGKEVGTAFTLCGLGTILMGWLTGGWFGNVLYSGAENAYGPQIEFFKAFWVDPLTNPIGLLVLALTMGVVHLTLGHITAIMAAYRRGRFVQGLITHLGWVLTLSFGSIFILWYLEITTANQFWQMVSTAGAGIGLVMGIIGSILERSGAARVAGPPQFLYDILGHIADTISYSRLLALGISSAVNAFLIDMIIVGIAWPSLGPGAGPVRVVVVVCVSILLAIGFVLLHLVNMGLNCLSGFVHTMRLHFAEYFGKFYDGDGDEFQPLRAERTLTKFSEPGGVGS